MPIHSHKTNLGEIDSIVIAACKNLSTVMNVMIKKDLREAH